ncbi:MAG: hypothetical protein CMC15_17185 [Flavobacteriaceae bacterium]|nr:hypothetical protein [Flavobacteriaceae bacterium]|tara:strand:- start:47 stop:637 length:591 start_codon:yes stop_codon:yes gene_type:complete
MTDFLRYIDDIFSKANKSYEELTNSSLNNTMVDIVNTHNTRIGGGMGFETDLEYGKEAEELILAKVRKKYPKSFMIEGEHKAYDIFVPEKSMGIEIKSDRQSDQTGNIFIEVECNNKKSGILATTAEWYVYKTCTRIFWCRVEDIRNFIVVNAPELKSFNNTPRGETSAVRGYLLPVSSVVNEIAFKVEELNDGSY